MKIKKIIGAVMAFCIMMMGAAYAQCNISASICGSVMTVCWNAEDCIGDECVLTLKQNGCIVEQRSVASDDGCARFELGCVQGNYTIEMNESRPAPQPTDEASSAPTAKPTTVPTSKPTAEPTAVPTSKPTVVPTAVPTGKPTALPTAVPTSKPTAKPTAAPTVSGENQSSMAQQVINQVNAERAANGLDALQANANLSAAALIRAQEIAQVFSHTRPDGSSWSTVSSSAYGENIAKGQTSSDRVMAAWMSSSGHRANILKGSYQSIGVACLKINGVYYWVQLFGH